MYVPVENPDVPGLWEIKMKGTLVKLLDKVYENVNGTEYRVGIVDVVYPNGIEAQVNASIWVASLEAFDDAEDNPFEEGKPISLKVQIDPDGEYDGYAKMQLPGGVVDTKQFAEYIDYSVMQGIDEDEDEDEEEEEEVKPTKKAKANTNKKVKTKV